jgi:hypothetical protein
LDKIPAEDSITVEYKRTALDKIPAEDSITVEYKRTSLDKISEETRSSIALFKSKNYIGNHVHDLRIVTLDADSQAFISLSTLFPNVITLIWEEDDNQCVRPINFPRHNAFVQALKNWSQVERVVETTKRLNISGRLLQ